jgi:hypothetical protein
MVSLIKLGDPHFTWNIGVEHHLIGAISVKCRIWLEVHAQNESLQLVKPRIYSNAFVSLNDLVKIVMLNFTFGFFLQKRLLYMLLIQ